MNNYTDKKAMNKKEFDFDYWCRLAKENPEVFEAKRKKEIEAYISQLGNESTQERMQCLQWRIEMERQRSKTPIDAAVRIYDMMWESVGKNFEAIQELTEHFQFNTKKTVSKPRSQAKVLKFNRSENTGTAG